MSQVYTTDISDTQAETPTCNATLASPLNRYGLPPWGYSFVCRLSHAAASDLFVQKPDYDDYDVTEGELKCFGTASLEPGRTVRVHGESVCPPPGMSYKVKLTPSDVDPHSFKHEGTEVDFTAILDETGLWMKNSPRKGWVELEGYLSYQIGPEPVEGSQKTGHVESEARAYKAHKAHIKHQTTLHSIQENEEAEKDDLREPTIQGGDW